jgi:hypothetical protein
MLSPELYPASIEPRRHLISFVEMSKEQYRSTSFLDTVAGATGSNVYTFNLDDLLLYGIQGFRPSVSVHYILHTAYCCSTLLARYLGLVQPCFALREPAVLAQIALLRPDGNIRANGFDDPISAPDWKSLLGLGIHLLTRTFASGDVVVIKVNDLCNLLGDVLLEMNPQSRIIFLYVPIRTFVLSVLKQKSRRLWLRSRLASNRRTASMIPALREIDTADLTDSQGAAFLWLINSALYNNLRLGTHSDRVLPLNGDRVAEEPGTTVANLTRFLELSVTEEKLTSVLAHPAASRYSKNMSIQYDASGRRRDLERMEVEFGLEADEGLQWAHGIKTSLEFDGRW